MAAFSLGDASASVVLTALTIDVPSVQFQPQAVRVVSANSTATVLLLGGLDTTSGATYPGVVVYGIVAAGSSTLSHTGSAVLPSIGSGVVQLSQTSALHKGYVMASTDQGVYKCASSMAASMLLCSCSTIPRIAAAPQLCLGASLCSAVRRLHGALRSISYPTSTISQPPMGGSLTTAILTNGERSMGLALLCGRLLRDGS